MITVLVSFERNNISNLAWDEKIGPTKKLNKPK
jgi:hypothetical protein